MTAPMRRILVSILAAAGAYAAGGAVLRGVASAPTRCPDRAAGHAPAAHPLPSGEGTDGIARRGSGR